MPRAWQASISSAAREMNNLEEREEVKKEKASVANGKVFKKDVSHFDWKSWIPKVRRYESSKHP